MSKTNNNYISEWWLKDESRIGQEGSTLPPVSISALKYVQQFEYGLKIL